MNGRSKCQNRTFLPGIVLVLVLVSLSLGVTPPVARAEGVEPPMMTSNLETEQTASIVTLPVPFYYLYFGTSPTAAGMIAAYYDRTGYPNIYTGPTNGGVMPMDDIGWGIWSDGVSTYAQNPLTASRNGLDGRVTPGSIDDYWVGFLSSDPDPFIGNWTEHAYGDAIGDYMRTSQSNYGNQDLLTNFYNFNLSETQMTCDMIINVIYPMNYDNDGSVGRMEFYQARGYTVTECYNQRTDNVYTDAFSFAQYKAEIDAGRPVLLNYIVETIIISVVGVGYNDATSTIYLLDPFAGYQSAVWGAAYSGWSLDSVSIVNLAPLTLNVAKGGTGSGTVTSTPAGIDCGATCSAPYAYNTVVKLTAVAAGGSTFSGWSGACGGTGMFCWVTMTKSKSVTATFTENPAGTNLLTVSRIGTGSGTVASTPAGIDCGSDCSEYYGDGTVVKLTATAALGSTFTGWSGACGGTGYCWVTMSAARSVKANFYLGAPPNYTLNVSKAGTGSGTVTSAPVGIDCGLDCSEDYTAGTVVRLTAESTPGSTFTGWSGACGGTGYCWVTMSAARNVTAAFILDSAPTYLLTVSLAGTGGGSVGSTPAGITCGADCSEGYLEGTVVKLTAVASEGSTFTGWSGACGGTSMYCWVTMTKAKSVTATFTLNIASLPPLFEFLKDPLAFLRFPAD